MKKSTKIWIAKAIKFTKRTMTVMAVFCLMGWSAYFATKATKPVTVYAEKEVPVTVEKMPDIPILNKIIQCESGGKQYAPNGQVLMKINTNKTVDIGVGQINSIWFKTASNMGYDLTKETDNRAFTLWLFLNKGSSPWSASSSCWSK